MSPLNGHDIQQVNASTVPEQVVPATHDATIVATLLLSPTTQERIADLETPFDPKVIEWRVTNTTKSGPSRGQVMPYADQRAYTDRLNALFSPAGWTRRYAVHTSANFERSKDKKIVAKVLVTCELTIFGLGSHSATGEEWADDDNAATAAEAQSFKRACSCFGLGRYLYHFTGIWVDLDDRKRSKTTPKLPGWATPEGWRRGLRPSAENASTMSEGTPNRNNGNGDGHDSRTGAGDQGANLVREIEEMERLLGNRMYRGLLKTVARVWNPKDIREPGVEQKVLAHMQAAARGFRRLDMALNSAGREALPRVLHSLNLKSIDQVDNLETLRQIVLTLEGSVRGEVVKQ